MSRYYKKCVIKDMIGYPLFVIRKFKPHIDWYTILDIIIFEKYCLKEIMQTADE
jgi:hypothetical protein